MQKSQTNNDIRAKKIYPSRGIMIFNIPTVVKLPYYGISLRGRFDRDQ